MMTRFFLLFFLPAILLGAAIIHTPQAPQPPQYHLFKVNSKGKAINAWDGPWACVCDSRSGLLWEVKTDNEDTHDGRWTYSRFLQNQGVPNNGDCYFEADRCDTEDLIHHTNREKLCGTNHWRLPTSTELRSLVTTEVKPGSPSIETGYFPKTQRGDYWSSDGNLPLKGVYRYLKVGGAAINFINGQTITIPYRNAAFTRLVTNRSSVCHITHQ
ncbi:DUF1566 domain-containing protein [Microbulbifer echini]|uniref:DUF1566 domain-containing protein n=1 Tax=Microbulbifer echini TaxID=1529067 RepID=A0ABV4NJB8_9GAMM|nr:DUF1566 domain-containing protein [uncultured Microbulbifer sp.]